MNKIIKQSAEWLDACSTLIDGASIEPTDRNRISIGLFHLALEHHGSIQHLIINKHYGSAFALLRPQFEAFIRGAWYHHCASDEKIKAYKDNEEPPRINKLISDIEQTPSYIENTLKEMKANTWSTLCAYTHGGYFQVAYRNTSTEIISAYDEKHITKLIMQSCSITFVTTLAIASLINNENLALKLMPLYDSIFNENRA